MKFFLLAIMIFACISLIAQTKSTGIYTTSTEKAEAFTACLASGKASKYGVEAADTTQTTATLWKYYPGGNDRKLQIFLTLTSKGELTEIKAVMPKLPNTMGSYEKEIKKYATQLKKLLPDLTLVSMTTGLD